MEKLSLAHYGTLERMLGCSDAEAPDYLAEQVFGQFYARPVLDLRTRQLLAVGVLTAMQSLAQLASHIGGAAGGLRAGEDARADPAGAPLRRLAGDAQRPRGVAGRLERDQRGPRDMGDAAT